MTNREIAEEMSLECPGNWPDDKSQEIRISYFEKSLNEAEKRGYERGVRDSVRVLDYAEAKLPDTVVLQDLIDTPQRAKKRILSLLQDPKEKP